MPSDADPAEVCRDLLRPACAPFQAAVARTIEEVRTLLDARSTNEEEQVRDAGASLGAFAAGRVDPQRFSALLAHSLSLGDRDAARIERAFEILRSLNQRRDALLDLRVPAGASVHAAVDQRLAEIGRAFGAAHVVTAIRGGTYDDDLHAGWLEAYPFARWSAAERALAPALFIEVAGADLRAGSLGPFLDGRLKIVVSVSAPAPVAPLARLIAPRTFVLQTDDPRAVEALAAWKGPGAAALVPEGAARFCHDPAAGGLRLDHRPGGRPRPVGGTSAAQQEEDLALLQAWSGVGGAAPSSVAAAPSDTAGQLATWLLQQANLGN